MKIQESIIRKNLEGELPQEVIKSMLILLKLQETEINKKIESDTKKLREDFEKKIEDIESNILKNFIKDFLKRNNVSYLKKEILSSEKREEEKSKSPVNFNERFGVMQ